MDPFNKYKGDVQNLLKKLEDLYDRWENAVRASDTIQTIAASENITNMSEDVEDLLLDLEETIQFVEQDRARFSLTDDELNGRKNFIAATRKRVAEIKLDLTKEKQIKQGRAGSQRRARYQEEIRRDNEEFIGNESQRQEQIYQDQDQDFDRLHQTVSRLGEVGNAMKEELEEQNIMLEEFNDEAEDTHGMMQSANKQVKELIKAAKKGGLNWVIIFLCIAFALVLILALGT